MIKNVFWSAIVFGLIYVNLIVLTDQIIAGKI